MNGHDVPDNDMPNLPWSSRADASEVPDASLSALLDGAPLPADCAPVRQLADALAALTSAPAGDELAGRDAALAEFRSQTGMSTQSSRSRRRRHPLLTSLLSVKAAATVAVVAVGLGGAATAAYAGKLPASVQQFAHDTIGAPATHRPDHGGSGAGHAGKAVGPNASGHSAYGLCTAYAHAMAHGKAAQKSVAFRNLVKAASGAGNVTAYCATVPHPGTSHSPAPRPSHPTGKPTAHPTHPAHPSHPTGKPTAHPTHPAHP